MGDITNGFSGADSALDAPALRHPVSTTFPSVGDIGARECGVNHRSAAQDRVHCTPCELHRTICL